MTNSPRICFMGTPEFAVPALSALHRHNFEIACVITQPDKQAGRGRKVSEPPVKRLAQSMGIEVWQPPSVKDPVFLREFFNLKPDLVVVAAFGRILPKTIIDCPPLGCINIHPSLLPKYRGAAPLSWTLINGETLTGVTIMYMDAGMDTGDILLQRETPVEPDETFGHLHDRLALMGADMLTEAILNLHLGEARRTPQDSTKATYAPLLTRETGRIDWNQPANRIVNLIHGLSPTPAAFTTLDGRVLKIFSAQTHPSPVSDPPGTVSAHRNHLRVTAADGHVVVKEVQLEGKNKMTVESFLRGYRIQPASRLG